MSVLKNKTLIVTGASMGIGRALARGLAARGVHLVLNSRTRKPLEEITRELADNVPAIEVRLVCGSAGVGKVAKECVKQASNMRNFFGFIHNAGVFAPGPLVWELPPEKFEEVFEANVAAAYQLTRFAIPVLLEKKQGLAVYVGSGAAHTIQPGIAVYSAAKAAEEHLALHVSHEAPEITSFVFRPGIVETRLQKQARESTGGGASAIHSLFRPWKEKGMLRSPEEAANRLLEMLDGDFRRYHGEIEESLER